VRFPLQPTDSSSFGHPRDPDDKSTEDRRSLLVDRQLKEMQSNINTSSEIAALHAFLRTRCGSPQAAFYALDVHSLDQLTSDDFVKGLKRLGYTGDATTAFQAIDVQCSGLLSQTTFEDSFGKSCSLHRSSGSTSLLSSLSVDVDDGEFGASIKSKKASVCDSWRSALSPSRQVSSSETCLQPRSSACNRSQARSLQHSLSSSGLNSLSSVGDDADRHLARHDSRRSLNCEDSIARADLYARLGRLEEQLTSDLQAKTELQTRVVALESQLAASASEASVASQIESVKQQLSSERQSRQVDFTSLRANVEAARNWQTSGEAEALIRREAERVMSEMRARLEEKFKSSDASRVSKLDDQFNDLALRVASIASQSHKSESCAVQKGSFDLEAVRSVVQIALKDMQPEKDVEAIRSLEARFVDLECKTAVSEACLKDVSDVVGKMQSNIDDMRDMRNGADADVEALVLNETGRVVSSISLRLDNAQGRLDGFEKTMEALSSSFEGHTQKTQTSLDMLDTLKRKDVQLGSDNTQHFEALIGNHMDTLRNELHVSLDEERTRSHDRAQALGRKLGTEFEGSILAQAVAKSKAAVSDELDGMHARIENLMASQIDADADPRMGWTSTDFDTLRTQFQSLLERCASLERALPQMAERLNTTEERAELALEATCRTARYDNSVDAPDAAGGIGCGGRDVIQLRDSVRDLDDRMASNSAAVEKRFKGYDFDLSALSARAKDYGKQFVSAVEFEITQERLAEIKKAQAELTLRVNRSESQRLTVQRRLEHMLVKLDGTCAGSRLRSSSVEQRGPDPEASPSPAPSESASANSSETARVGLSHSRSNKSFDTPRHRETSVSEKWTHGALSKEVNDTIETLRVANLRLREEKLDLLDVVAASKSAAEEAQSTGASQALAASLAAGARVSSPVTASGGPGCSQHSAPRLLGRTLPAVNSTSSKMSQCYSARRLSGSGGSCTVLPGHSSTQPSSTASVRQQSPSARWASAVETPRIGFETQRSGVETHRSSLGNSLVNGRAPPVVASSLAGAASDRRSLNLPYGRGQL